MVQIMYRPAALALPDDVLDERAAPGPEGDAGLDDEVLFAVSDESLAGIMDAVEQVAADPEHFAALVKYDLGCRGGLIGSPVFLSLPCPAP